MSEAVNLMDHKKESDVFMGNSHENENSVFSTLAAVNVNDHVERKGNLTYLSWAWAWQILKSYYPDATYKVYEDENGWFYHTDGRSAWVKVSVTVQGIENVEYLPVMDYRNNAIPLERLSAMDVNKAIQRGLTKAIARHGLGLYIYAGEDLPDASDGAHMGSVNSGSQTEPPKPYDPDNQSKKVYRSLAIEDMRKLNLTPADLSECYGVSKETTDKQWEEVYKKLQAKIRLNGDSTPKQQDAG